MRTVITSAALALMTFFAGMDAEAVTISIGGDNPSSDLVGAGTLQPPPNTFVSEPPPADFMWVLPISDGWDYSVWISATNVSQIQTPYYGGWTDPAASAPPGWTFALLPGSNPEGALAQWTNLFPTTVAGWNNVNLKLHSVYAPGAAKMTFTDSSGVVTTYDYAIPLTPEAVLAGIQPMTLAAVPEPREIELIILGIFLIASFTGGSWSQPHRKTGDWIRR